MQIASAANAWAPLSVDPARHLVFAPTGSASPDFFGGERPGDNRWANSVVALDGATGALKWGRQLVHHDLWDYDVGSQPTLATLMHDGQPVAAVIQATKTGFIFTFDRDKRRTPLSHRGKTGAARCGPRRAPLADATLSRGAAGLVAPVEDHARRCLGRRMVRHARLPQVASSNIDPRAYSSRRR